MTDQERSHEALGIVILFSVLLGATLASFICVLTVSVRTVLDAIICFMVMLAVVIPEVTVVHLSVVELLKAIEGERL